ncbi:permease [Nocardia brasiliensis]|uniref:Permease n=1 Tax=Nocardia brasiliensis TaxID=37326 RepID=A0A6G9XPV2_NOCBR|nr:permease [Nocardia brasiliensis]QIS02926.1 permease [Nocardia brasiliensis]
MTATEGQLEQKSGGPAWRTWIIGGLALLALLVVAYFILSAFIPRWWAQRIAEMVNGSFAKGIGWGLVYGVICTFVPLLLLLFAVRVWRRRAGRFLAGVAVVLAALVAIPNLMTLTIVLGGSNAAHAGQRILDVDAPAFRGAALVGAIAAAVLWLAVVGLTVTRWWRRRHPKRAHAQSSPPADAAKPMTGPGEL